MTVTETVSVNGFYAFASKPETFNVKNKKADMKQTPAFMTIATLVAVFAALSPTALVAGQGSTCSSLVVGACGAGYVLSRRDNELCTSVPCDVTTVGEGDHLLCCMVRRAPSPPGSCLPLACFSAPAPPLPRPVAELLWGEIQKGQRWRNGPS